MENMSAIFEWLNGIDTYLLLAGNGHHTPFMDQVMWIISGKWVWVPMYILLVGMLYQRFGAKTCLGVLLFVAALIALADMTCSALIRPAVCRMRPSCPDNPIYSLVNLVNGYHGRRYGFPSCHGANTFALAVFLSLIFKKRAITIWLIAWSLLVSYSRVYLGVHYPGDIFVGYCVGGAYAVILYQIFIRMKRYVDNI
ncbi:MAG: phosphatase PAP2 family protein [Paramuribaculum sp.]|nr:phosphatase PAP2 family protein [Paramuribaculum sp.]